MRKSLQCLSTGPAASADVHIYMALSTAAGPNPQGDFAPGECASVCFCSKSETVINILHSMCEESNVRSFLLLSWGSAVVLLQRYGTGWSGCQKLVDFSWSLVKSCCF